MVTVESSKGSDNDQRAFEILVEVWDIGKSLLVETFVMRKGERSGDADDAIEPHGLIGVDADTSPSAAIAALVRARQAGEDTSYSQQQLLASPAADVRALVVGMEFGGHSHTAPPAGEGASSSKGSGRGGFMITASEDRKIRLWDLGKIERSTLLCGVEMETGNEKKPTYRYVGRIMCDYLPSLTHQ